MNLPLLLEVKVFEFLKLELMTSRVFESKTSTKKNLFVNRAVSLALLFVCVCGTVGFICEASIMGTLALCLSFATASPRSVRSLQAAGEKVVLRYFLLYRLPT